MKVAFLGPEGTYTHQAVLQQFGSKIEISPQQSIGECFNCINSKKVDYAVVPFENSTNGQVVFTYDLLRDWFLNQKCDFKVVGEQFVSIHHNLLGNGPIEEIKTIYSHPQVWTQVTKFLKSVPNVTKIDVCSTSKAAELVSLADSSSAAISSIMSSQLYNLPIIQQNIEDNENNTTRFLILGYEIPEPQNTQKITSIMLTLPHDDPGALCDVLVKFKENQINLTSINSRPSNLKQWQYVFFVEVMGELTNELKVEFENSCLNFIVLGEFYRTTV
ncbi:PHA2 [Candida jiufengensis]|uniref:PHA2 n=1 Tax=Candida jiufengensis TaxID=497108 RepID=UPI00222523F1|nr:PHA2 [Candida jiufengensis]KAI5953474.1 PHA2 [Candida jiufengensis]